MIEFGQPFALWTGLAIALPIIAHLAYRRIAYKLPFSSLRFLRFSTIPRSGRKKPSDWFLLILRTILFILITLLLADPYWRIPDIHSSKPSDLPEYLFLLDSTPSMSGWNAWDDGLSEIRSRLKNYPDYKFGLITVQNGSLMELPVGTSVKDLISGLEEIYVQDSPVGLSAMIDRAHELFSSEISSKNIVLISDFQKSSWQEIAGTFAREGINLELFPVGHGGTIWQQRSGNCAILDTRVASGGEGKIRVWTALRNFDENRKDLNVSIVAGGKIRQINEIILPPLGTEQIQFKLPAEDFAQATVRIEGKDAYPLDDNQSLWILPPLPRTFGFWTKSNMDESDLLESQFLRAAMESAGTGIWDRWQEDDERSKELRLGIEGAPINLLLVLGLSGWFEDEKLAPPLLTHLEKGGKVLITPPQDSHVRMNQALNVSGLLNFTFGGMNRTAFRMEPYRFEVLPESSRLDKVFSGDSVRDLYLSQIQKFISIEEGNGLEVPLYDRAGRPLVLIRTFPGGGRIVFFSFRMLPEWSDLPMRNSFLPLLIELCGLNKTEDTSSGTLRLEAGDQKQNLNEFTNVHQIGLFQVGEQRLEVVHPLVESMPEVMAENELYDALVGGTLQVGNSGLDNYSQREETNQSLWLWFALSASIFLLLEMILSAPSLVKDKKQEAISG